MPLDNYQLLLICALPHLLARAPTNSPAERAGGPDGAGPRAQVNAQSVTRLVTRSSSCAACGASYSPTSRHQKYCSARCRQRAYNARQRDALMSSTEPDITRNTGASCAHCGASYSPTSSRQKYCCASCRVMSSRARRAAAERALAGLWGIEPQDAGELIESRGLRWAGRLLDAAGLVYLPAGRCWVGSMGIELTVLLQAQQTP